jgi:hypothetical protein
VLLLLLLLLTLLFTLMLSWAALMTAADVFTI